MSRITKPENFAAADKLYGFTPEEIKIVEEPIKQEEGTVPENWLSEMALLSEVQGENPKWQNFNRKTRKIN